VPRELPAPFHCSGDFDKEIPDDISRSARAQRPAPALVSFAAAWPVPARLLPLAWPTLTAGAGPLPFSQVPWQRKAADPRWPGIRRRAPAPMAGFALGGIYPYLEAGGGDPRRKRWVKAFAGAADCGWHVDFAGRNFPFAGGFLKGAAIFWPRGGAPPGPGF